MNNETIEVYINKIIFYNKDNNYYIISTNYDNEELVVVGSFSSIEENQHYEFTGSFVEHAKYGIQFKGLLAKVILPKAKDMVISFLSGSDFIGIGVKKAEAIVIEYEDSGDILQEILDYPEKLLNVKGINSKHVEMIISTIQSHLKEDGLFYFLKDFNINYNDVISVFNKSGCSIEEFISILKINPYLLMNKGISFKLIDKFAASLDVENYLRHRSCGAVLSLIKNETFISGSTFIMYDDLLTLYEKSIFYNNNIKYEDIINELISSLSIVIEDGCVFEYQQYEAENFIAEFILEFKDKDDSENIDSYLVEYENKYGITFNEKQKQAITNGINCSISIITGGPGTGKSTIVDALVKIIKKKNRNYLIGLAAPTGRAAKRLSDLTNESSMTIHKLLKADLHANTFNHNVFNPLELDVLIIDESSMIDNLLMASLLKASFNIKKIILLGDYNQLPSVANGQILKDLIDSDELYVTKLEKIYRQSEDSKVIELAYKVLNKDIISKTFFDDNVSIVDANNSSAIMNVLMEYTNYHDLNKAQILAPIYKGKFGIDNINKNIQKILHENCDEKYNINDRVIQLKNRNEDEIYNGDIGIVKDKSTNALIVEFDNKQFSYSSTQQFDLNLAYCISVHKSQGNEYDFVILFLPNYSVNFIDNKILYTAITRAKKKLVVVSDLNTVNNIIQNDQKDKRKTKLKDKIKNKHF